MAPHRMPDPASRGRNHRPHHISSIAHHFLGEVDGPEVRLRSGQKDLVVCSASTGPLGAWVSAGLVRSLKAGSVILAESSLLAWSATSYLQEEGLDLLDPLAGPRSSRVSEDYLWRFQSPESDRAAPAKSGADPAGADESQVVLRNLGTLNNRRLGELEAVHLLGNPSGSLLPGADALVWCLTPEEAGALGATYTLGRALALFRPLHLEVLVVEGSCLQPASPKAAGNTPELIARCRQLAENVASDLPSYFSHVSSGIGSGSILPADIFTVVGQRVLDSD